MSLRIHGRRTLKSPPGYAIRPTSSRIRQSLFGILQDQVQDSRWLDLCCGAGTIGAEALSRGAALVVGVESSRAACATIHANWAKMAPAAGSTEILQGDARHVLRRGLNGRLSGTKFDVIYLDPPYESPIYPQILPLLPSYLADHGFLFVEHSRRRELPNLIGDLKLISRRAIGQAILSVYRHSDLGRKESEVDLINE